MIRRSLLLTLDLIALVLLLLVLSLLLLRLWLPQWEGLAALVEERVGTQIEREVRLGTLSVGWRGWSPELVARDIWISTPDGVPLRARELGVSLAPLRSLAARAPVAAQARLRGVGLQVERDHAGTLQVHGWRVAGPAGGQRDLGRYIERFDRIEVEDASLEWIDHLTGVHAGIRVESLSVRSDASGLRAVVQGRLLPEAGGNVRLGLAVPAADAGSAEFFVEAQDLQFGHWGRWVHAAQGLDGQTSVRIWGDLRAGRVWRLQGEHDTRVMTPRERGFRVDFLSHSFQWRRDGDGAISRWVGLVPGAGNLRVHYTVADGPDGWGTRVEAWVGDLDLGRYARIAERVQGNLPPALAGPAVAPPSGNLETLHLVLSRRTDWDLERVAGTVRDLRIQAAGPVPGVDGVDIEFDWGDGHGTLSLAGHDVMVRMPELFGDDLWLDRVEAELAVRDTGGGWSVDARRFCLENADLALDGRGGLELGPEPHLDLAVRFLRGDGSRVARYLPVHRLPAKTYRWLVESIIDGSVVDGGMVFRGRPSDFPFAGGEGVFDLHATVSDGLLDYQEGWPGGREVSGNLIFRNAGFQASAVEGRILDSMVSDARFRIADMLSGPVLEIEGRVSGPVGDLSGYMQAAGIGGDFRRDWEDLRMEGDSELDLALRIPLHGAGPAATQVSGNLHVSRGLLEMPEVPIVLGGVVGEARFDYPGGLRGRGIRAVVHGESVELDIARQPGSTSTQVRAVGRQPIDPWLRRWGMPERLLRGSAHWEAEIRLDAHGGSRLELRSDLEGVEVDLPPPLGKTRGTWRPLHISWPLQDSQSAVARIRYDDVLAVDLRLDPNERGVPATVTAVAVGLGLPAQEMPAIPARGVNLRADVTSIDLDGWVRALERHMEAGAADAAGALGPITAELRVRENVRWAGRSLSGARLRMNPEPDGYRIDLGGDWLRGQVRTSRGDAPDAEVAGRGYWQIDLDRLHLAAGGGPVSPAPGSAAGFLDPRVWPAVDVGVRDLRVGDARLSGLNMSLRPVPDGLDLRTLRLQSADPGVHAAGSGHWLVSAQGQPQTELFLGFGGNDWGKGLAAAGIAPAVEQGTGTGRVHLVWEGAPFAPNVPSLQGQVELDLADGRLLEVDPGAGRLLGLVSLDVIPRRMRLDFRDVYTEGLSFDQLVGTATIASGDMHVRELRIRSPSAVIRLSGRTGLVARDFDQTIVVVPRLRSTLPIVGALLGGPVTGVVVLLVERVLGIGAQVEEAARVEYSVTGSWSNPVVQARVFSGPGTPN